MVDVIQTDGVDFQFGQGFGGYLSGDNPVGLDLGVITDPLEQSVGNTRGTPGPPGDFPESFLFRLEL